MGLLDDAFSRLTSERLDQLLGDSPSFKADYDLQLFGIRSKLMRDRFDDVIGVRYHDDGECHIKLFPATTDPGLDSLERSKPTAIVARGFWPRVFAKGTHRGKYPCLVQCAPIGIHRERTYVREMSTVHMETCGIQVHSSGLGRRRLSEAGDIIQTYDEIKRVGQLTEFRPEEAGLVGPWSAGCQVLRYNDDLEEILALLAKQEQFGHGNKLSYFLFGAEDL